MDSTLEQERMAVDIIEDAWAVLRMTGYVVIREHEGLYSLVVELTDENIEEEHYYLDNGHGGLPDGSTLRVRYRGLGGPEVFSKYHVPRSHPSWQQKAVEPALQAIQKHRETLNTMSVTYVA